MTGPTAPPQRSRRVPWALLLGMAGSLAALNLLPWATSALGTPPLANLLLLAAAAIGPVAAALLLQSRRNAAASGSAPGGEGADAAADSVGGKN